MALPAQVLRPENRSIGMGVYFTVYYALMGFLPAVAGMTRDLSGSVIAPALFAAGMMIAATATLVGFRVIERSLSLRA